MLVLACDRGDPLPDPPPVPLPVPVPVKREPTASYVCEPPRPPSVPTKVIPVANDTLVLDEQTCVAGAFASGIAWSLDVRSRDGETCRFEIHSGHAGPDRVEHCTWNVAQPKSISLRDRRTTRPGCAPPRVQHSRSLPGSMFSVTVFSPPDLTPNPTPITPIARGTTYRVGYRLFEDREHTRPSKLAGTTGELVFRYGMGEAGQAIEHLVDNARGDVQAIVRSEVAQGLRVPLARSTELCVTLTVLEVTPPTKSPPTGTCAATEEWTCQVGPTSTDRTASARGCGCGLRSCPSAGFRWITDTGRTWPDGAHELRYECIDDQERIRRTRALRKP